MTVAPRTAGPSEPPTSVRRYPHRYRLHRAGIRNVWQYDNAEFLFGDGRLLLRGKNGAGKSKALEMLLPFLLDGDARALDATGTGRTSLRWLMLDGSDASNRLGYLWLELRRIDTDDAEQFLTLGAAIRASRSTNDAKPLFFLTPQRVGHDLLLVEGGQPLPLDRLKALAGDAATFDTAKDYRTRVAKDVFGLTDSGRYRNLTHLLHRLRKPTIGDRIEAGGLASVLSEALPPIDDDVVDDVARNLDDLDAVREELARLVRTDLALTGFLAAYRGYLHGVLRRLVTGVRDELEQLRAGRRSAGAAERELAAARVENEAAGAGLVQLRAALDHAETDLRALRDSADYTSLTELRDRRRTVNALSGAATAAEAGARSATGLLATAGGRLDDDTQRIGDEVGRVRTAHSEALESAVAAGIDAVHLGSPPRSAVSRLTGQIRTIDVEALRDEAQQLGRQLANLLGVVRGRLRSARQLADELRAAEAARDAARAAEEESGRAESRAELAAAEVVTRTEAVAAESAVFAAAVTTWCADSRLAPLAGSGDLAEVVAAVELPVGVGAADRCLGREVPAEVERAADAGLAAVFDEADAERDAAVAAVRAVAGQLAEVRREHERVRAEADPTPPRSRFVEHARDLGTGAPLYLLVDFVDEVEPAARAGLEAALEASGLLDGWLRADGVLLDAHTRDTVLTAGGPVAGHNLTSVLRPVAEQPATTPPVVAPATVAAVLSSVGLGPAARESAAGESAVGASAAGELAAVELAAGEPTSWVAPDGRWRLGVASGAYRKAEAEYVGATVRAQTRARRLAELAASIAELELAVLAASERLDSATARRDGLRAARRELPRGAELDRAWTRQESATRAAAEADRELADAREHARQLTTAAVAARRLAEATASAAGLPADAGELGDLRRRLEELLRDAERLRGAAVELPTVARRHPELLAQYRSARDDADHAMTDAVLARERHEQARRELAEQESAVGASEQALMAREADATARRDRAVAGLPAADRRARDAVEGEAVARVRREQALADLARQERAVVGAGQALRSALLLPALPAAAGIELPETVSDADLADDDVRGRVRRLDELAAEVGGRLGAVRSDQSDTQILRRGQELDDALPGGLDAPIGERAGIKIVEVRDDAGSHPVAVFAARIARELDEARTRLSEREQEVFRRFLLGELGDNLSRQMTSARTLVEDMNRVLADVRSSHGIGVRLVWEVGGEADADTRAAVDLLATPSGLRTPEANERLREALQRLIESQRSDEPGSGYAVHLRTALDYRAWHTFDVRVTDAFGRERRLGPRTGLSQGEQRVVSYLVLFAAAAAHFSSLGQADPTVPRLILLDDAFAKVDEPTHAKLLELLVDLDLDFVLTSERLWGNAPAVPHLHVYECLRDPLARGVATLHYEWNGHRMRLVT